MIYVCYQVKRLERDYPSIFFASPNYETAYAEMQKRMESYATKPVPNKRIKNVWVSDIYRFEIVEVNSD